MKRLNVMDGTDISIGYNELPLPLDGNIDEVYLIEEVKNVKKYFTRELLKLQNTKLYYK
jgi:hypothetical protein